MLSVQQPAEAPLEVRVEVAADAVAAQRQRHRRSPPATRRPRSTTEAQPQVAVGELPLVDDHARVHLAGGDHVEDAVEGRRSRVVDLRLPEAQRQVGGGQLGRGSPPAGRRGRPGERLARDHDRAVAVAEARARGHELVAVGEVGVGVEGEGGDLVGALEGAPGSASRCRAGRAGSPARRCRGRPGSGRRT